MNNYEREIVDNVDKHGWHAVKVFDPDGKIQPFSYSVGFPKTLGCPDCLVIGLHPNTAHSMLWEVFDQIKGGKTLFHSAGWQGLVGGDYLCRSVSIPSQEDAGEYRMLSAEWFWSKAMQKSEPMRAFQIVWPSTGSRQYPWEDTCPPDVKAAQPIVGERL